MGYDVCIKRVDPKISQKEWLNYIENDFEFELINEFHSEFTSGGSLDIEIPNSGLWKNEIPFVFYEEYGEITVKNPDIDTIKKMISVANVLNAVVIGENKELYDESYLIKQKDLPPINVDDYKPLKIRRYNPNKKWWQFWKRGTHL